MNNSVRLLTTALLAALASPILLAPVLAQSPAKKLYCWNENGRKICGDALPADAVDSARTEISAKSGMATSRVDRALSTEERAAAAAQAWIAEQNAAAEAATARRDMAMVESYANEAELQRAFQHRITLLDETVKASQFGAIGMRQSLLSLLRRASEAELAGQPVAAPLAESILGQHQALRRQEALLVQQRLDRSGLDTELAQALERYRELKRPGSTDNG